MKKINLFILLLIVSYAGSAQLMVTKLVGKDSEKNSLGFGVFAYYDFPIGEMGNQSIRIELMDLAFFPAKNSDVDPAKAYISIKLGYKYIFSEEGKTGFYIEPQAGYCRVVATPPELPDATYGDGIALAMEAGYSLEVGARGNAINFGLKFENDRAGKEHTISSIGFRVSYSFNLFKRRDE